MVFWSSANDLVPGDANAVNDVFVRDLVNGITTIVSVDSAGVQSVSDSLSPQITSNSTNVFVTWNSSAIDLVTGITDADRGAAGLDANDNDVFIRTMLRTDLTTGVVAGTTRLVSQTAGTASRGGLSSVTPSSRATTVDGTSVYVTIGSASQDIQNPVVVADTARVGILANVDIFLVTMPLDLSTITSTALVSIRDDGTDTGNVLSTNPSISADARFVVFQSFASNLLMMRPRWFGT